jgi:hypothetical protein
MKKKMRYAEVRDQTNNLQPARNVVANKNKPQTRNTTGNQIKSCSNFYETIQLAESKSDDSRIIHFFGCAQETGVVANGESGIQKKNKKHGRSEEQYGHE